MESIIMSASCALLGLEVLLLWKYQRDELRRCREGYLTCLEEVARTAEITKRSCFTNYNPLEALPSRTRSAELKSCDGDASICTDDASIERPEVMAAPLASQAESLQARQASVAQEKASSITPSEREPAKPARRSIKKKPARREARKPLLPMNGVGYSASAAKSTMAVKLEPMIVSAIARAVASYGRLAARPMQN